MSEHLRVSVNPEIYTQFPNATKKQIREALTQGPWRVPYFDPEVRLPQMGRSSRGGMSTAVKIGNQTLRFFTKSFEPEFALLAEREKDNILFAQREGINIPPWLALVQSPDMTLLMTMLKPNAVPFSNEDLTFSGVDKRYYSPQKFLDETICVIATMHNRGLAHGDLYLRNIGFEYLTYQTRRLILFDLELGTILPPYISESRENGHLTPKQKGKVEAFELQARKDLLLYCQGLYQYDFPWEYNEIVRAAVRSYSKYRLESRRSLWGMPTVEELEASLLQTENKTQS